MEHPIPHIRPLDHSTADAGAAGRALTALDAAGIEYIVVCSGPQPVCPALALAPAA